jgi:chromosome segregation ATPase
MIIAGGSVLVLRLNQRLVKAEVESRLGPVQKSLEGVKPALEQIRDLELSLRRFRQTTPQLHDDNQVEALSRRQASLERKLQADLQNLRGSLAKVSELEERLAAIQNRLGTQGDTIEKLTLGLDRSGDGIQRDLKEVSARVKTIEGSLQEHQAIVREVQRALQKARTEKEIDEALAGINNHLKELEGRIGSRVLTLEGRAGTLDRKLDALERQLLQLQAQPARQ